MGMSEIVLRIDGMHCGSCVRRATQALQKVPGAQVEEVRIGAARVNLPGEGAAPDQLIDSLKKAGFPAYVEH
jgi:copper chaperone CopZ